MDDFYDQSFVDFTGGHIIAIPTQPKTMDNTQTATGANNAWWEAYGATLAAKGLNKPSTIIRLNWEANIQPWGINKPDVPTFVKAYNNTVASIKKTAPQVRFTLGFSTGNWPSVGYTMEQVADMVGPNEPDGFDYIELDGYDHSPGADTLADWTTQSGKTPGREKVYAYAQSRQVPMWIGEWGVSHSEYDGGGDNPYFIQRMYDWISARAVGNGGWLAGETTYNEAGAPAEWNHELYDGATRTINEANRNAALMYQQLWSAGGS
jgi:hypothetical protein